jgi:hypothetical protein
VGDGHRGFGPSGGGGGEAEGKFNIVAVGNHIGAGRSGAEPRLFLNEEAGTDAPGHRVTRGGEGTGGGEVLADGAEGAGKRPRGRLGGFLKFAFKIDEERGDRAGGVLFHGGVKSGEVGGGEDGIVVDHEEVSESGKFFEGVLARPGETATEAEVFSWRKVVSRKGGIFYRVGGGGVGPVIADDGGGGSEGLAGEGVKQAGQEWGTVAGSDKGDHGGRIDHGNKMADERAGGEKGVRQKRGAC